MRVAGIISDITSRNEASAARLAEASERFARLLDVVGAHVYVVLAFPDGRFEELFQGPGSRPPARRRRAGSRDGELGGGRPSRGPSRAYDAYNAAIAAGEDAEAEYRLVGADGITRWVHDRARCRRRADGAVEASGIVSDVTERRHMRAELAQAHAALSQAVDAMDAHLYTLRVDAGRRATPPSTAGPTEKRSRADRCPTGPTATAASSSSSTPRTGACAPSRSPRLVAAEPIDLEYRVIGLDGRERIVADRLRAAARRGRHPLLRRRHAGHHGAPAARGRAAAHAVRHAGRPSRARGRPRGGRAARADGRADRGVQPPPLHRDRGRRRSATTRTAPGCCCSTPITSST